jgi:HD-GYP domain-containing protein (c-di-GMP phosphodiesterase class II)
MMDQNQIEINLSSDVFLSSDKTLNSLLKDILGKVKKYGENHIENINKLIQIGLALSIEKDINALLEKIVDEARSLTNADAGTLYICDETRKNLDFTILQNDTMGTRIGGKGDTELTLPKVPLFINDKPNYSNVSSYVALTGKTVNIPDVYTTEKFDFTGPREYDQTTGYRSKSMLVHPLINHENDVIGVLQLLNAQDPDTGDIIPFVKEFNLLVGALASQAAVALNNAQLVKNMRELLYSFIEIIAKAIDEKSPYTGGHIKLVVQLSMMIAEEINASDKGPFKDISFNEDQIEELRLAAWMHDVGKITTPEYVVDKSTKLETVFDRIHLIELRFQLIEQLIINKYDNQINTARFKQRPESEIKALIQSRDKKIKDIQDTFSFIQKCSQTGEYMSDEKIERIKSIGQQTYTLNGRLSNYLTEDEIHNLCIRRGTLTDEERKIIENHSIMTFKMLEPLPFPRHLLNVPLYASGHHERVDGKGYPYGVDTPDLAIQARIMAIADIFEALTARDRPYRGPMKLSQAIDILNSMKDNGHIDPDIFELFMSSGIYLKYAHEVLSPDQIDM